LTRDDNVIRDEGVKGLFSPVTFRMAWDDQIDYSLGKLDAILPGM
jgi:hypothetical protein